MGQRGLRGVREVGAPERLLALLGEVGKEGNGRRPLRSSSCPAQAQGDPGARPGSGAPTSGGLRRASAWRATGLPQVLTVFGGDTCSQEQPPRPPRTWVCGTVRPRLSLVDISQMHSELWGSRVGNSPRQVDTEHSLPPIISEIGKSARKTLNSAPHQTKKPQNPKQRSPYRCSTYSI